MAYNREKIEAEAVEVVKREKITFFTDLEAYLEPSLSTLYEWGLEKYYFLATFKKCHFCIKF